LETIRNALITSGIPDVEDFNTGNNFGVSYFDVNQHEGKRWNTASGFLNPILKKRKNITLLTNHLTNKLIFDGNSNTRILGV
jgi:choline dehydrogenase